MHKKHHHHQHSKLQTPPDVKVHIQDNAAPANTLVKLVSVGTTGYGRYTADREFWKHPALTGASFTSQLTLQSDAFAEDDNEAKLNDFLSDMSTELVTSRTPTWTKGMRDTIIGNAAFLYKMASPDTNGGTVGVLFEVGISDKRLKAVKFYQKAASRPDGGIWTTKTFPATTLTYVSSGEPKDLASGTVNDNWWWA